ncbi:MAG: helix-turn-helix domain-containing protein [Weeksellaceae bacterium]
MRYHPLLEGLRINEDGSEIIFFGQKLTGKKINRSARPTATHLVNFNGRTLSVARLVCEAWHGLAPDRDHNATRVDPDKGFHYTNLFWAKKGVNPNYDQIKFPRPKSSKIPESEIPKIVERLKNGETLKAIAKEYGTSYMSISRIRKRFINGED